MAAPVTAGVKANIIIIKNLLSQNEILIGSDVGKSYCSYLKISWYEGLKQYIYMPIENTWIINKILGKNNLLLKKNTHQMYGHFVYLGITSGLFIPIDNYNITESNISATAFSLHGIMVGITVESITKLANGILLNHTFTSTTEALSYNGASGIASVTIS